ncbi:MAG: hypothetical protein BA864_03785 [Desulfuromonadales bacterium C00003093]|nr:MAG: hypothetical protein BA864_03785 [Desulfuromonadales bacterium C00003093]
MKPKDEVFLAFTGHKDEYEPGDVFELKVYVSDDISDTKAKLYIVLIAKDGRCLFLSPQGIANGLAHFSKSKRGVHNIVKFVVPDYLYGNI